MLITISDYHTTSPESLLWPWATGLRIFFHHLQVLLSHDPVKNRYVSFTYVT